MFKKLIYLISFVLVLSLVGSIPYYLSSISITSALGRLSIKLIASSGVVMCFTSMRCTLSRGLPPCITKTRANQCRRLGVN